ncbi:DUF2075 domain-containing protein [Veillonella intestinalis]|uniref:DUF2075 domain-containing protein n=1 Tax=Veillonella intestinalis TaxID=2941341 RepID=UPI00203F64DA|nr:DUF2075 domain-containing protein [Veillonella intestinalis]
MKVIVEQINNQDSNLKISFESYSYILNEINLFQVLNDARQKQKSGDINNGINFLKVLQEVTKGQDYLENWPILYILRQEKSKKNISDKPLAYIGQSTNVIQRMKQHLQSESKKELSDASFIFSSEFNQSVTLDYESKLIQMFAADGKYVLLNSNRGLANKKYYNKTYYDDGFEVLWEGLRKKKIVQQSLNHIKDSDLFKYSPYKELNQEQYVAAMGIMKAISSNSNDIIIVNGMPGSGKTIIAIYMFKRLSDVYTKLTEIKANKVEELSEAAKQESTKIITEKIKRMAMVIPQTSLRKTIKKLFANIYGLNPVDVVSPSEIARSSERYDIVFVDEAHRLRQRKNIVNYKGHDKNNKELGLPKDSTELDWILCKTDCPVLFFDTNQVIGPSGINEEIFEKRLKCEHSRQIKSFELKTQMRVEGGETYLNYVKFLLQLDNKVQSKLIPENYEFKIFDDFKSFQELYSEKSKEFKLVRLIAGYAWPWKSKKDKSEYDIEIDGYSYIWNVTTTDWVNSSETRKGKSEVIKEVGSIHCIQGYDLNYGFVILGPDIKYDVDTHKIYADKTHYFDTNGKKTATDEELTEYVKHIYYVLLTRGIKGTYVYACDSELRTYLKQYIDVY